MNLPQFVLASGSPRRRELLHYLGIPFTVHASSVDETINEPLTPPEFVKKLATRKADAVKQDFPDSIILGADTVVVHHDNIIGKPKDTEHARSMIRSFSKSTHQVITGLVLIKTDKDNHITQQTAFYEATKVIFGAIDDQLLENYLANGNPLDKAGGYGIQDKWGAVFTEKIDGDFYNVMGLPVHALYHQLNHFAPEVFDTVEGR